MEEGRKDEGAEMILYPDYKLLKHGITEIICPTNNSQDEEQEGGSVWITEKEKFFSAGKLNGGLLVDCKPGVSHLIK